MRRDDRVHYGLTIETNTQRETVREVRQITAPDDTGRYEKCPRNDIRK